jgi:signal transduction histidine kinase
MNNHLRRLTRHYASALRKYLADEQEAVLAEAYDLGRLAIARGLGVLDMARVHQQAIEVSAWPVVMSTGRNSALKAAHTFFLESLSPFEVTHRGFRETNVRLQQLIATLEKRNLDLAEINRELQVEISERKRTERALRESEQHLRELFNEAHRMEQRLRNLSNQVLHAQEEERKRISRELHDEVGQALMALSMTLAGLKQDQSGQDGSSSPKLADAQQLLQATMETVHDFARELRPTMLDELGLLPTLRSYLKGFARRTGLAVQFRGNTLAEELTGDQKTVLYRVAQESLTNVAKHARASRVAVALRKVGDRISMEIADNGRSFRERPESSHKPKMQLGLLGMQERVRLVNGKFNIEPRPGRGTTVRVAIPFASRGLSLPASLRDRSQRARISLPAKPERRSGNIISTP